MPATVTAMASSTVQVRITPLSASTTTPGISSDTTGILENAWIPYRIGSGTADMSTSTAP